MSKLKLHLDADVSIKALHSALLDRGHDVTRTPNDWIPEDASDEVQLTECLNRERCIVTFNIKDFMRLAGEFPQHSGILLAAQKSWSLSDLVRALDRVLTETSAEEWKAQVGWLTRWR
ncbi:MAG: DUF5615 family PIN-like protein [Cyanobacteria bacterium J06621_11]